jgi:enoyl-CoA hydratase/carnithine racemase
MADLLVNDRGDWLDLTVNRPERRNALTPDLLFELADVVKSAGDKALIVLRGAGDRAFSSGFDLGVLRELGPRAHDGDPLGAAVTALLASPVPTIAVLRGYCWGAAVELVAACDLRLGSASTSIAVPAGKMGAVYRPSGMDAVARRFGHQVAVDLFVFGMAFDATAALGRGLISAVLDEDGIDNAVQALVERVTSAPALAAAHKQFLREWNDGADELLARWQAVRDAAVATRTIPTTTGGGA